MKTRVSEITRETRETRINLVLTLDGKGRTEISTGVGFADHMLTLLAFWAEFDLTLTCVGDLHIDSHHTLEDVGICLGQALLDALGDRKGIRRVGWARMPMDEALAEATVDLSGRPYFVWSDPGLLPPVIAGDDSDVWREFFKSLATGARMNLHMGLVYGKNGHHLLEAAFKGLGLALRDAVRLERTGVSSTKGSLD